MDTPDSRIAGIVSIYSVCYLGGISGRSLRLGSLSVAVLFPRAFRRFTPQLVWAQAFMVARGNSIFTRTVDSLGAGRNACNVLLLSGRLL